MTKARIEIRKDFIGAALIANSKPYFVKSKGARHGAWHLLVFKKSNFDEKYCFLGRDEYNGRIEKGGFTMFRKSRSLFLMTLILAGALSACSRKQQPDTLAAPNALELARARAASQQVQEPITPSQADNANAYNKSSYIK